MKYIDKVEQAKKDINAVIEKYSKIVVFNSFGKDSMVVFHLAWQIKPDINVVSIMTPFKFKETFDYKKIMEAKYKMNIKTFMRNDGPKWLWKKKPNECCEYYKIQPTKEALRNYDAWITGLRRTEGKTRTSFDVIEKKGDIIKVNPILDFEEIDVWRYLAVNNIPVNPMYAKGYRSLGCEPCSSPEEDESDLERDGRWRGCEKQECGMHSTILK